MKTLTFLILMITQRLAQAQVYVDPAVSRCTGHPAAVINNPAEQYQCAADPEERGQLAVTGNLNRGQFTKQESIGD